MTEETIRVWDSISIPATSASANLNRRVDWKGGRGWIIVNGFTASPGVNIETEFTIPDLTYFPDLPGVSSISADGVYPFDAPAGEIGFQISLNTGDSVSSGIIAVAIIEPQP